MEKATIICVDDERVVLIGLKSQLKRLFGNKYYIETANSGEEAIEILDELNEDNIDVPVVISDQIMPGMKGDTFLKYVKKNSQNTLTIMLTGQADANAVGRAVNNANLYSYISKPWSEIDLNMTVKEAIKSYFQSKKIQEQNKQLKKYNEELEDIVNERTKEIVKQKEIIEVKNEEIMGSIKYARKIQRAILPSDNYLKKIIPENFVFYKPKDIISGDFYWLDVKKNGDIIVLVADCTGHGVPGAFMSMLGIALINEIVNKFEHIETDEILNQLRQKIIKSLNRDTDNNNNLTRDGMDIALLKINKQKMQVQYSGAYNPLIIIRDKKIIFVKGDRMPVGIYIRIIKPFTSKTIDLVKGDMLYIFSDGYADQFGGKRDKKFLIKNLKKLLLNISKKSVSEQKKIIYKRFKEWKGAGSQIDDIIVMGIRI